MKRDCHYIHKVKKLYDRQVKAGKSIPPFPKIKSMDSVAKWILSMYNRPIPNPFDIGVKRGIVMNYLSHSGGLSSEIIPITRSHNIKKSITSKINKDSKLSYQARAKAFYKSREWKELRYRALKYYGARCCVCGRSAKDGVVLHVDHIIPLSKNWDKRLVLSNLQIMCEDCNIGKSNTDTINWRKTLPEPILPIPNKSK